MFGSYPVDFTSLGRVNYSKETPPISESFCHPLTEKPVEKILKLTVIGRSKKNCDAGGKIGTHTRKRSKER